MTKRIKSLILEDFINVECALSPENLTCDGELPKYMWKKKLSQLNGQRRALITELGYEPNFEELYGK